MNGLILTTMKDCALLRVFPSSVSKAKYLAFGTPNTQKIPLMRCSKCYNFYDT